VIVSEPLVALNGAECFPAVLCRRPKRTFSAEVLRIYVALERAGCSISIAATYRPPERAYLMWAAWMIHKKDLDTRDVPEMPGVDIEWNHGEIEVSKAAASAMCRTFGIISLKVAPAITSEHISGFAVDMNISWAGSLSIEDRDGKMITINSGPTDNMNTDLQKVGASFGVHHFFQGALDRPHWSINAR